MAHLQKKISKVTYFRSFQSGEHSYVLTIWYTPSPCIKDLLRTPLHLHWDLHLHHLQYISQIKIKWSSESGEQLWQILKSEVGLWEPLVYRL